MSALAQALIDQSVVVSGSDRLLDRGDMTDTLTILEQQGVKLHPQDGSGISMQTARLVTSTAIEPDNPEVLKAYYAGLPTLHRASELARLVAGRELVAVTGTCGKSSVTAMLGCLLEGAGFDPLVVNGAAVPAWSAGGKRIGSVRKTSDMPEKSGTAWAVIEADESDKSLMAFEPQHVVITNASADHFGIEETHSLFSAFRDRVKGVVIDGRNDQGGPQSAHTTGWSGTFTFDGVEYKVPMPGLHNIHNAWHAVRMARALGAAPEKLVAALANFSGIERRLQRVGMCNGAVVVDDYAHNPEKLSAAWNTLAEIAPQGICALWRPHGYAPLRKMSGNLITAFARICRQQDTLLLLPVYDAGGTADRSIGSSDLAIALTQKGVKVLLVQTLKEAEQLMRAEAAPGKTLATFGARDHGLARLARQLTVKS